MANFVQDDVREQEGARRRFRELRARAVAVLLGWRADPREDVRVLTMKRLVGLLPKPAAQRFGADDPGLPRGRNRFRLPPGVWPSSGRRHSRPAS